MWYVSVLILILIQWGFPKMLNQGRINDPTLAWGIPNPWEGVEVRGLGSVGSTQYSGASRISYGGAILDWWGGGVTGRKPIL